MILFEKKGLFIHIPKAAGSSIIASLKKIDNQVLLSHQAFLNKAPFRPQDFKFNPPPPHFRAIDFVKYGLMSEEQFNRFFKFSFVRNPYARLVSEYKYRHHAHKYPFKDFVFKHLPPPSWNDEYCHIIPQYDYLFDEEGTQLVDFVGKFENIQEDFKHITQALGLGDIPLSHENQSKSWFGLRQDAGMVERLKRVRGKLSLAQRRNTFAHYSEYYDNESQEFVASLYANDIKAFKYSFE